MDVCTVIKKRSVCSDWLVIMYKWSVFLSTSIPSWTVAWLAEIFADVFILNSVISYYTKFLFDSDASWHCSHPDTEFLLGFMATRWVMKASNYSFCDWGSPGTVLHPHHSSPLVSALQSRSYSSLHARCSASLGRKKGTKQLQRCDVHTQRA